MSGLSATLPLLFLGSSPNDELEKLGDGYAVIQDLTARAFIGMFARRFRNDLLRPISRPD